MFLCIICDNSYDISKQSQEHIIPYSIGGNLTLYDVCINCNKILGNKFDKPLIDDFVIKLMRHNFNISDRQGYIPDIIGSPGISPEDPNIRVGLKRTGYGLYILPSKKIINGVKHLYFDKRDIDLIEETRLKLKNRGSNTQINELLPQSNSIKLNFEFTEDKAKKVCFGLIKIVYELAYKFIGASWLKDPSSILVRSFLSIKDPKVQDLSIFKSNKNIIKLCGGFVAPPLLNKIANAQHCHSFALIRYTDAILIELRLFEYLGIKFIASTNPQNYQCKNIGIAFDTTNRTHKIIKI